MFNTPKSQKFQKSKKQKALEPLIASILLIVVSVILVVIILSWGKNFTLESTKNTTDITKLKPSDATFYIHPKTADSGYVHFNYSPPNALAKEEIVIKEYIVANIPEMTAPIKFKEEKKLSNTNILELPCLYEYSSTTPELYIQLITTNDTYIDIKIKEQGMVCVSGESGDANVICTANDLNNIRNNLGGNYILGKDIDLGCFLEQDVNGWEPIGTYSANFTGTFNGQNHTISNLYINRPEEYYVGLFGYTETGSEIKNIKLKDVNVIGYNYVGGLVGQNYGTISNSYTTGAVSGTSYVGGLVGYNYSETISNSYTTGTISGTSNSGGLVGYNSSGTISNSYSLGDVIRSSGTSIYFGGFLGYNSGGTITNCYSTGKVIYTGATNPTDRGFSSSSIFGNNYWDINASLQTTSAGGATGKSTTEMKTQSTFTGWNFVDVWDIESGTYPYLRSHIYGPNNPKPT